MLAREFFEEAMTAEPAIGDAVRADLSAIFDRDPACHSYAQAFLFFKGFHALECHRIAHWLWKQNRKTLAYFIQSRVSALFAVDIHPAARIGRGIFLDHATGIVIGETAVVEDDVSMLHGVTLGGTGKETGDRHPKIRRGVLLSAGAKVLGNIEVGEYSRVAAGSVVLKPCRRTARWRACRPRASAAPAPSVRRRRWTRSSWARISRSEPLDRARPLVRVQAGSKEPPMTRSEIWRIEKYLRNLFRLDTITVVERPKQDDSVEVHVSGEFIGVLFKDEEDGEVSYAFNMAILEMDLPEPPASRAG
jgi:serine O-acetyltransferase